VLGKLYFLNSCNSRVDPPIELKMAESQNIVKESLGDKESRLLRELEELKQAERITELEHELAELKARQKIKALEHQVEEQKRAEEVQKLKFRVEEVQDQPQLDPEQSCGKVPTRDPDTQPPAKTDRSRDLVPVESTTRDDAQQADSSQPTLAASIDSGASRSDSPALDRHNSASTPIDPPHNSAPAKMNNRPSSNDNVQREPSAPISMSEIGTSTRPLSTMEPASTGLNMEAATLQYYQELDGPADNSPELLFYDMDLEQLYDFASICEGNQEKKVGDLRMLSRLYYFIFTRTGTLDDIQKAIHRAEKAVEATHTDDVDYAPGLRDLIVMLLKKHERTNSLEDLDRAILLAEVMITVTPSFHYDRPHRVMDLVKMKFKKAGLTGSDEDLNEAMTMAIEAMSMVQSASGGQASHYLDSFNQTGDVNDLNMAVSEAGETVAATPHDHPNRAATLNNLAVILCTRFERTGDLSDLNMAIARVEEAVAATPHDHPNQTAMLNNLAVSLSTRFERTGDLSDLNMAIAKGEEAGEATPHDHPDRSARLTNLAVSLLIRFERTGDLNDLNMAITKGEEAVAATPHDHPNRAAMLNNLTVSLRTRFERTGDLSDLNMAIARVEEAVAAIPHDHPNQTAMLNNLTVSLRTRFERTGDLSDLNMAIAKGEEAVAATPHDYPNRAAMLNNLTVSLRTRFERTGDLSDLNMAIAKGEEAVAATPHDHPDRAGRLTNLANSLLTRFVRTGDLSDLNMAIAKGEEAVAATPHDHPDRAGRLTNLASSLQIRFQRTGAQSDTEKALHLRVEAAESPFAPPHARINSASSAAKMLANNNKWAEVSRITEIAVNLLPTVAPRQLKQQDQQHILGEFAGLAALAASAALEAGKDASQAVQLLELGRGVIAGLRFGTRSDLTKLKEQHLEMAEKFEQLRDILDSPSLSALDSATGGGALISTPETNQRHNASFELEEIINQIRCLPNFENFLRPPQVQELMAAAFRGPIVLINVSEYRCDALVVETQAIRAVPLPDLRQSEISKNVELMKSIRSAHTSSSDATSQVSRMLEWLWDVIVRVVLNELGFTAPPSDDNWPRVWWIPTGQLSLLPLHAAGRQSPLSKETTLDRVVSSYTPSIKALLYARENSQKKNPSSAPDKALLVSMDTTPGHSDLRFAKEEVEKLASSLPDSIPRVILERPLRETVLSALNTCTIFHFAGHGESHPSDPSRSSLLITDWEKNPLMFEDLIGLNLSQKSPWLAYLSACSTSENQTENLHDEAIHLVTACQLAGFQHVVGSLWEVSDQYSVNVAEEVYKTIVDDGVIDGEKISWGVHNAVRRLRDITSQSSEHRYVGSLMSGEEESLDPRTRGARRVRPEGYEEGDTNEGSDPLVWAAYIHVGL
jgi:CHAT domain-containing protein